mmetsp:Transcript_105388/g.298324  ORF Transcript_105388/g.298324 Transcript_105388/m.298324 type:complete len:226 (-) Transcript_105388:203-880(-)
MKHLLASSSGAGDAIALLERHLSSSAMAGSCDTAASRSLNDRSFGISMQHFTGAMSGYVSGRTVTCTECGGLGMGRVRYIIGSYVRDLSPMSGKMTSDRTWNWKMFTIRELFLLRYPRQASSAMARSSLPSTEGSSTIGRGYGTRLRSSWSPSRTNVSSSCASCCWYPWNSGRFSPTSALSFVGETVVWVSAQSIFNSWAKPCASRPSMLSGHLQMSALYSPEKK